MADLSVKIAGVSFKNPVITASGTFGFGREFSGLYDLSKLGGISCKGTTLNPRLGNDTPRIAETPSGILNSVGLQNPGVDWFIKKEVPWLKTFDTVIIANVAGNEISDYCSVVEKINDSDTDMIELNISCPNVKHGGAAFGTSTKAAAEITKEVRRVCKKPLIVKLSPNVTSIGDIAEAVESEGADAVSLINTITGMKIDINTRRPLLKNNTGGLSGAAVLPIAVRMVWEVYNRVSIPIIGMGGITKWQDAVEIILAGASAIQVGTVNFTDPYAPLDVIKGLEEYLDRNKIFNINELTGMLKIWE